MKTPLAALAAALILAAPLAANAQDVPSYASQGPSDDQQIRGRIANFDGGYNLQVRDDKGYIDNVVLHPGTIINPTGLELAPGMVVSILGFNQGPTFAANEIDTPYTYYGGVPYYGGHPWNYYGPSISLGFFFGNTGWWHGGAFGGYGYRYAGGVRVYNHVVVRNVYRGGAFQGHRYIAPASRGGYVRGNAGGFHGGGFHGGGAARGAGAESHARGGGGGGEHHR
jgi:hypothetical protein